MKYLSVDPLVVQHLRTTFTSEPITASFFFDFKANKALQTRYLACFNLYYGSY